MNDIERNIRFYLPNLIKLGGPNVLNWQACEATFLEVRNRHVTSGNEGKQIEANIYELILAIKNGSSQAYRFINFFDLLLESLHAIMDDESKKKIKPILTNIFSAHDHKFMNFIGELMALSKLLQSKIFLLNNVEVAMPNKKRIDFEFINLNQDGRLDLLEIHNVHLDDDKVEDNDEKLFQFFLKRRMDKVNLTRENLPPESNFMLMQIYWGSFESLRIYASFFKRHSYLKNMEPLTFSTTHDPANPYHCTHKYGRIHEVFADHIM